MPKLEITTDGGPWAEHNQRCAVCHEEKAVLDISTGYFWPCWRCYGAGWSLIRRPRSKIMRKLLGVFVRAEI